MSESLLETPAEISVQIRSYMPDNLGGTALATVLETAPDTLISNDTSACCEDCPDVNDNPPDMSECPYFEYEAGRWPVCTREGNSDEQIGRFFFNR